MSNIDKIFDLYLKYGNKNYIGEQVTQLEHAHQAASLAKEDNCSKEFIIGAFLHDIGHLLEFDNPSLETMNHLGVMNHETIGAEYLRRHGFPELSCVIVENHVKTKRYLVSKNSDYYNNLSNASKQTMEYQGGLMTQKEVDAYENSKYFEENIRMRKYDDLAKDTSEKIKKNASEIIDYYRNMAKTLLVN